jgi:hypothetical protein
MEASLPAHSKTNNQLEVLEGNPRTNDNSSSKLKSLHWLVQKDTIEPMGSKTNWIL